MAERQNPHEPYSSNSFLLAHCSIHPDFIISDICAAEPCNHRLLCLKCKEDHSYSHLLKNIPVIQIFAKDLNACIEDAKKKESNDSVQTVEQLYTEVDSRISSIRDQFLELLEDCKLDLYEYIKHITKVSYSRRKYSLNNWDELKAEYQSTFDDFLCSQPGKPSPELDRFIHCYTKVFDRLELHKKEKNPINNLIAISEEEFPRLIASIKDSLTIFSNNVFLLKNQVDDLPKFSIDSLKFERTVKSDHIEGISRQGLLFLNNLNYFVSAGKDGSITLWDGMTIEEKQVLEGVHNSWIYNIAFSEKRNLLFTASGDTTIKALKVGLGGITSHIATMKSHKKSVHALCVVDREDLLISGGEDEDLRVWGIGECKLNFTISTGGRGDMGCGMVYMGRTNSVAIGLKEYGVGIFSLGQRKQILEIRTGFEGIFINGLKYVEEKNWLVCEVAKGKVKVWELKDKNNLTIVKEVSMDGEYPGSIATIPNSTNLVVAGGRSYVHVVDMVGKKSEVKVETGLKYCNSVLHLPRAGKFVVADRESREISVLTYVQREF